ncbi:MAG: PadR family transcriptional regulator [Ancalomicrobiaceae bacterium]|nr:PadR family transcriptional regulator [Ancalomicrobiaceae bacterium]
MYGFHCRHDRHDRREGRGRCGGDVDAMRERMHRGEGRGEGRGGEGGWARGFGAGFGRGFGRRGGGRFFDHGDLKLVILALIAEKPRHGYELIKAIEDKAGGAYSPSPGVIYPTLTMLEELGHVTVETVAGNRKEYRLTEAGQTYLSENAAEVRIIMARMTEAGEGSGMHRPQMIRAVENLRTALHLRLASGAVSAETIATIAAALDEAAGKIERS